VLVPFSDLRGWSGQLGSIGFQGDQGEVNSRDREAAGVGESPLALALACLDIARRRVEVGSRLARLGLVANFFFVQGKKP
jgi:hypothetical protein